MIIRIIGGPYDGMSLSPLEIQSMANLVSIPTKRGLRQFGVFPLQEHPADSANGQIEGYCYYELVNTVAGPHYEYDLGGKRYREALSETL